MLAALSQAGVPPVFTPAGAHCCQLCGFASAADGVFFREDAGSRIVCQLCRYSLDHRVADTIIHLLILPEFSQSELNVLLYTLVLRVMAAPGDERMDGEVQRARQMLDALIQRVRDSQVQLPVLGSLSGLRHTLAAAADDQRVSLLQALAGLRFVPNLEHQDMLRYFRQLLRFF